MYRNDRSNQTLRRAGGVAVLVHQSLKSKQINLSTANGTEQNSEFLAIEVIITPQPLIVYACYISEFDLQIALRHYERIKFVIDEYRSHKVMVVGDFNIHDVVWSPDDEDENGYLPHTLPNATSKNGNFSNYQIDAMEFLNKMFSLSLSQLSNIQNRSSNVLDLVFVNNYNEFRLNRDNNTIIEQAQQDPSHVPYEILLDFSDFSHSSSMKVEEVTAYQYARGNYDRMMYQMDAINFQHEFKMQRMNFSFELWSL